MPSRFVLTETFEALAAFYGARPFGGGEWRENYNIGAGAQVPVLVEETDGLELGLMQWGLIPYWAKDAKIAGKMINAEAVTIAEKPGFRDSFKDKRCIIPATGFYEWQKLTSVKKPHYFAGGELLSFAGLWSQWVDADSRQVESCAIVTVAATGVVKPVSDTMPLMLDKRSALAWMAKATMPKELHELMAKPAPELTGIAVGSYVNAAKSSGVKCIAPKEA
ncbi:MAG: SOS response-associated peptidase [Alphaproteobacteria bacterium]|nr:SOS response-associated peptidase [Alphaproteobacteria bacterium]